MHTDIIPYKPAYKQDFYDLNIEWLETFFYVESVDKEVLSNPETYIIDKGGQIFFALIDSKVVGTVALMPYSEKSMELTKMAVSPNYRGYKIGQLLMKRCIGYAKDLGLYSLVLYSNTKLENAIYIYRKYGFVEIPVEPNSPYIRSNIKMKLLLIAS